MKTQTEAAIRAASKAAFHGGLRAAGFRRQGNHLHRRSGGLIHAFNFQASRGMAVPNGAFTVNLLVTSEHLYRCWTGRPLPANPATVFFPIQARVGLLMPQRKDLWWSVETEPTRLCREVVDVLVTYGLPFFDTLSSVDALLEQLRKGGARRGLMTDAHLIHAMLAKEKGFDDEAAEQIREALAKAAAPFRETVMRMAERLDLAVR
jgi:hypothetical protein